MTKTEINDSLWKAAEEGDVERLKALVAAGADANYEKYVDETVLMKAVENGNVDCVRALIAAGADVNAQQKYLRRHTALMKAVEKDNADCVQALIVAGADLNRKDHVDETALWKAVQNRNADCLKALIAAGADLNKKYHLDETVLAKAVERGKADWVKALIAAGADVNAEYKSGTTVLKIAHPSVKGILRAAGAKRKIDFKQIGLVVGVVVGIVLVWAGLAFGFAALMHRLSPSFPTWGAGLLGAVSVPFIAFCVAVLLDYLDSFSSYRKLLLFGWAILAFGIAALAHWFSPWFPTWAAAGLLGIVAAPIICPLVLLLPEPLPSRGQINAKDVVGKTPLMEAAENGDLRRVKRLIAKGADVNAQQEGYSRSTALILAVEKGHADCVRALIATGADVNAKDKYGNTALTQNRYKSDIAAILQAASSPTPSSAPPTASMAPPISPPKTVPKTPENNLSRWKASGNPEKWVDDHHGQWTNADWLDLLWRLKLTEFWPMEPDAIRRVLEEQKKAQPSAAKPVTPPSKASAASAPTVSKAPGDSPARAGSASITEPKPSRAYVFSTKVMKSEERWEAVRGFFFKYSALDSLMMKDVQMAGVLSSVDPPWPGGEVGGRTLLGDTPSSQHILKLCDCALDGLFNEQHKGACYLDAILVYDDKPPVFVVMVWDAPAASAAQQRIPGVKLGLTTQAGRRIIDLSGYL